MNSLNNFLLSYGYLAIFFLTVLEAACIPIPSEITLGLGGAMASGAIGASKHHLDLGIVIAVAIAGEMVGSLIAYTVGRTGGRAIVDRYGRYVLLTHKDLDRAEAWFAKRGEPVVLFGRVVPVVRCFISLAAGLAEMQITKFVIYSLIGISVWVTVLCSIGYAAGSSWESVTKGFGYAGYVAVAAVVVLLVIWGVHRYRHIKEHGVGRPSAESAEAVGAEAAGTDPTADPVA
jgi:membrane protein DedA with SNARE-associated domain